jgi:uncharacterized membrane protein
MPYQYLCDSPTETRLALWPYRSLTPRGFVWFFGATASMFALPLAAVVGSRVLWGVLPFILLAVSGLWVAIRKSWDAARISETLVVTDARADLVRRDPQGERTWTDNPYWVTVRLHPTGGPVPNYVTLRGRSREVEIGAFLSEEERIALHADLTRVMAGHRNR